MNTCNSSCCKLFGFDGFATGERYIDVDSDGEDLCTWLSLPVRGGEGEAIVSAGVKGKNLQFSNCSIQLSSWSARNSKAHIVAVRAQRMVHCHVSG